MSKEYIERGELLEQLDKYINPMPGESGSDFLSGIATAITEVEDTPAADVVGVTRCKDCARMKATKYALHWCTAWRNRVEENGFCYYGERVE